jgi:endonuclease/exonuclease/phosphatase family metal-dependent hydrolase
VAFDALQPYGPLVEGRVRVVTWNVWERYGPWEERQAGIQAELARVDADVVALQESWPEQAAALAGPLGFEHSSTDHISVLSRWPISEWRELELPGVEGGDGLGAEAAIDGPRGPIRVFVVALAWRLEHSHVRQGQVRALARMVGDADGYVVLLGDFNAAPDSDEIRMLTGRVETGAPGVVFYDAWEVAGDGGPGHTWSNANHWANAGLLPPRRIDYVFTPWPRRGGAGHPIRCDLIGVTDPPSDHYGVLADLRY